jgi:pimeloyl-ACP methyl ester carboxylesterase
MDAPTKPPIEHAFAEVNGIRLHFARAGSGKLLLFVHGFPEFWYAWRRQLAHFGEDHLAVAPDLRGYNLSSKPAEVRAYEVPTLVEDLRQLTRQFTQEKFCLVGHDWGGGLCWAYAMLHPEELEKLIIINAPHPGVFARELRHNRAQQRASAYMLLFRSRWAEPVLGAFNYWYLRRGILRRGLKEGYFTKEDEAAYLAAWSQPGALTGGLNYYRAARVGPVRKGEAFSVEAPGLASFQVRVPTLVIWGERDPFLLTGNLDGLEEYVPDLTIRRVPDANHWIVHQQPELVNQLIREFIGA